MREPSDSVIEKTAAREADVCEQTSAAELTDVLQKAGYVALVNLLQEGVPLSERQIARRLKISRSSAQQMLRKARELLIGKGIELPRPHSPALVAGKLKAKTKPKIAVKAKAIPVRGSMAKQRSIPIWNPPCEPRKSISEIAASIGVIAPASEIVLAMIAELMLFTARRDPHAAVSILTRYASHGSFQTTGETGMKLHSASI